MARRQYRILHTHETDFDKAASELADRAAGARETIIRVVFFCKSDDNGDYTKRRDSLERICCKRFGRLMPMIGLVAQAPLWGTLAAEVTATDPQTGIVRHEDYAVIDGNEIVSGDLRSDAGLAIGRQADAIFGRMGEILAAEGFSVTDIVRQWNYIERITAMSPQGQHYQQFNDARSRFYDRSEWPAGYPAATGIGTQAGGVAVMFDAIRDAGRNLPVDNPLQIAAHAYSQDVLIDRPENRGKTTPKFERARYVAAGEAQTVYISGTAAIRGEESCRNDLTEQIDMTMNNIDTLIGTDNLRRHGASDAGRMRYAMLRVYLKRGGDIRAAEDWMQARYPDIPTLYLLADVCRDELLVEIEGMAVNEDK